MVCKYGPKIQTVMILVPKANYPPLIPSSFQVFFYFHVSPPPPPPPAPNLVSNISSCTRKTSFSNKQITVRSYIKEANLHENWLAGEKHNGAGLEPGVYKFEGGAGSMKTSNCAFYHTI